MKEKWKKVEGFDFYEVSNIGRARSIDHISIAIDGVVRLRKGKVLSPGIGRGGYERVNLWRKKQNHKMVHVLVMEAFGGNRPTAKHEVNHKNGNKRDNDIENLEWMTRKENIRHAFDTGLSKPTWKGVTGKGHPMSKPVYQFHQDGGFIAKYGSSGEAAVAIGVTPGSIQHVMAGRNTNCKGFIFKRAIPVPILMD